MRRAAIPLAVALSLLLALFGCGGDGGSDTAATTQGASGEDARETSAQKSEGQGGSSSEGSSRREGGEGEGGGGGASSPAPPGAPSNLASLPEPVEGSKRAAPGVPVSEGGDNSIQTWGTEALAAEREEVTAILKAFYEARAAGEWARACAYLAAEVKAEFAGFVKGASGNPACVQAMGALAQGIRPGAFAKEARIGYVLSLRVDRGNAFLLYTRPGERKVFANAFADENGAWKVTSVGPTVIY